MDDDDDNEGDLAANTRDDASDEVTEEQRKLVIKSYVNLGHPDRAIFFPSITECTRQGGNPPVCEGRIRVPRLQDKEETRCVSKDGNSEDVCA